MTSKDYLGKAAILLLVVIQLISGCASLEPASSTQIPAPTKTTSSPQAPIPTKTASPEATSTLSLIDQGMQALFKLISQERIYDDISSLSVIQNFSGWRNSGSAGEAEAQEWVAGILDEFTYLKGLGLELERQEFHVFLATEIWENRLFLTIAGQESQVPVFAISGHRELLGEALRFDSDGQINDDNLNPVHAEGEVLVLGSASEMEDRAGIDLESKIVLIDFQVVDPGPRGEEAGIQLVSQLIEEGIAGLVLVTERGGGKYDGVSA